MELPSKCVIWREYLRELIINRPPLDCSANERYLKFWQCYWSGYIHSQLHHITQRLLVCDWKVLWAMEGRRVSSEFVYMFKSEGRWTTLHPKLGCLGSYWQCDQPHENVCLAVPGLVKTYGQYRQIIHVLSVNLLDGTFSLVCTWKHSHKDKREGYDCCFLCECYAI